MVNRKPTYEELERKVSELKQENDELRSRMGSTDFHTEIKRQSQAEADLHKSRKEFRRIASRVPGMLYQFVLHKDGTYSVPFVNDRVIDYSGYSPEQIMSEPSLFLKPIHPEDMGEVQEKMEQSANSMSEFHVEHRLISPSGEVKFFSVRSKPRLLDNGDILWDGISMDVTERKHDEHYLHMIVEMLNTAPNAITIHDFDGRFLYANRKTFEIHGYEKEEFMALNLRDLNAPESEALIQERMQAISEKGEASFTVTHLRKDGSTIPMEVFVKEVDWADVPAMLSIATDITERKKAEEALQEREKRFRDLAEMLPEAVFEADSNMNLTFANKQAFEMFGYTLEDFESGLNGFDMIVPEDRTRAAENAMGRSKDQDFGAVEYRALKKDGSIFPVLFHTRPIMLKGMLEGFRGIIVDMTERRKIQEDLQKAQKMESIGILAGGIAHDFNNLLFPIIGMSEILLEDLPPGNPEHENAQEILNAGLRGRDLVKQILAFSRQSEHKNIPVRVQNVLKEVVRLCQSTIPSSIEIVSDIQPDCGLVSADPTQLHQIAMNLMTNAYQAIEEGHGKIMVQLAETGLASEDSGSPISSPGRYALLSVADTGCGINPAVVDKIFEPYFTTKPQGKGTGLGLAVAYGIVRQYGGDIKVHSELGKGTTVSVYLPLMVKSEQIVPVEGVGRSPVGSEWILLVDDEEPIARLEKQMLERLGYKVTCRLNSLEALEAFKADPARYDLVITDMTMPNMTGDLLAREIVSMRPDLPVIICTGFSERINREKADEFGIKGFLMKPVVKSQMAQLVRQVLDSNAGLR